MMPCRFFYAMLNHALSRRSGRQRRVFTYVTFGGMVMVLVGDSMRTIYLTWNWSLLLELAAGDARLAG
ncbi:Histone-lysine N-methyltransferase ASHR3 [Fusarium oxysporum f. sp. albedinis]|nr:Histone-lysine N-methyltransferase ASHR3 [Fusarium oxysporum f. sp. albedinis]